MDIAEALSNPRQDLKERAEGAVWRTCVILVNLPMKFSPLAPEFHQSYERWKEAVTDLSDTAPPIRYDSLSLTLSAISPPSCDVAPLLLGIAGSELDKSAHVKTALNNRQLAAVPEWRPASGHT